MTTAFAQRQTRPDEARRRQRNTREEPAGGRDEFAVLIRLPDLSEPPEEEEATDQSLLVKRGDAAATAPQPMVQRPVGKQLEKALAGVDDQERVRAETKVSAETTDAYDDPPARTDTGVLRAVLQAAIAIALIGTFITVYVLIADRRSSGDGDEVTGDRGSVESPAGEFPIERSEPADIAVIPALPDAEQNQRPSDPVFPRHGIPDKPADPQVPATGTGRATGPLADGRSHKEETGSSGQGGVGPRDAVSDFQRFGLPNREPARGLTGAEGNPAEDSRNTDPSPLAQTMNPPSYKYPVTDPSRFQYPEKYHTRIYISPDMNDAHGTSPASERRSGYGEYGRQQRAARLQPRIQPPSTR